MAESLKLGLVIGGAVSATVGKAFKEVESKIKALDDKGAKARILQSTIGETIKLRDEWKRAHDTGSVGASMLLSRLNANLSALKAQGVEVSRLGKAYEAMGRTARAAELKAKGRQQIEQGRAGLKSTVGATVAATAMAAIPTKISADYGAIIRDIAIKAGVANTPQEAQMSKTIIQTSRDTGMARNDVAEVVNALVGAGMELKDAISYAPTAAKFVVGQGADGADTAKMINALGQNAKISDPKVMQQALEAIAYQGQAGSFEASDMARWFPELLASMGKLGITGMDSVSQLGAILQVQMKTAGSADEAANNFKNWVEKIGSNDTVTAYKKAGIDYQKSMETGLQKGMSTVESSFALAQKYIEKVDPEKAKQMAEATAKISKEADPAKAKAMMNSLEQALRTGDLFADMQVKAALTAFMQNKELYETLKKDSREASGILDKNLAERRSASAQMWKEVGQSMDDGLRSVGDAIAPATDAVASGLTSVARSLGGLSDSSLQVVGGVGAAIAGWLALKGLINSAKIARGLMNVGRGTLMGDPNTPQKVIVTNMAALGGAGVGGAGVGSAAGAEGKKNPRKRWWRRGPVDVAPVVTSPPAASPKPRMRVYAGSSTPEAPRRLSDWRPPTSTPGATVTPRAPITSLAPLAPVASLAPTPGRTVSAAHAGRVEGKGNLAGALFDAAVNAKEVYETAQTRDEKAEGYGTAAGSAAGTLAGAAAGAAIGSIVPIIGTAIGGMIGAWLGSQGGAALGGTVGKALFGGPDEPEVQVAQAAPPAGERVGPEVPSLDRMKAELEAKREGRSLVTRNDPVAPVERPRSILETDRPVLASAPPVVPLPGQPTRPPLGPLLMMAPRIPPAQPLVTRNEVAASSGPALGDVAKALTPKPAAPSAAPLAPKAEPPAKPMQAKVEQKVEIHAPLTITVQGDVKDPRQWAQELQPYLQQQQRDISAQLERSKLYDEPHV
jgi:phage tail tape-measure protein